MSSKFSLLPILQGQLSTLVDSRTGKARFEDYFVLLGVPSLVAVLTIVYDWQLGGVSEFIAGVSILTSFLFALAIYVFQLRIQLGTDLNRAATSTTVQLVDEMFANTCWAIVVGLVLTGSAIFSALGRESVDGTLEPAGLGWSAWIAFLAIHLVAVLAMSLKRLNAAYDKLNN